MTGHDALVLHAVRTPIARLDGDLRDVAADALAATVLVALAERLGELAGHVDDVIIACAAGPGGNIARRAALDAGLRETVPGITIDRQCGGGLDAIALACRLVESGAGELYIAGGVESASTSPLRELPAPDTGVRGRRFFPRRPFAGGGCDDPGMAESAEIVAADRAIGRNRQDAWAARSHGRAAAAVADGTFDAELVPCATSKGAVRVDSCPRPGLDASRLARLAPVVRSDGTVTAGNASQIADGAAAAVVASRRVADRLGIAGMRHVDSATAGVAPRHCGLGAIAAVGRLRSRDPEFVAASAAHVAMTEAFASQMIATVDDLGLDPERVNPQGGAIALGHPWAASGAIQVVRLHATIAPGEEGLALAAIAGGMGTAARFVREAA